MATRTIREGKVTTQILDLTNGIGGKSAEVRSTTNEKLIYTEVYTSWTWTSINNMS
jgi:hypothetical protein